MEFIEKHKALIITSMLMGIFVLSLYNINMVNKRKQQSEILMEIPEELMEELTKEEEPETPPEEERELIASKRTHDAFNEDFEDSEDFEQRIKSLTETEEATEEASNNDQLTEGQEAINEDITSEEVPVDKKEEKPIPEEVNNRNSSVTFILKGREKKDIPNPIYTCNGSGKVVVKIEVNQNGYVIDAKIDKKKSTTRNECLFDNALDYAQDALFSSSEMKEQKGFITYYFNYGG
ncbi:hypothetical protein D1818_16160 [Aquimarina sp. BL5]|uniref:hypothetical protein n=1 Tax=Aquimarina sp. BL5 TaxID=1714860 RepID=UPI000E5181B2|nr:hypothetical protein [Aquimarina sp. BL5]AXT52299.1 hypothetical protein D1818_16160 [Aquimarina sp. BL5]RKN09970.1 hypothetical protein D7036_03365 [Aquimarina sp. BL5]